MISIPAGKPFGYRGFVTKEEIAAFSGELFCCISEDNSVVRLNNNPIGGVIIVNFGDDCKLSITLTKSFANSLTNATGQTVSETLENNWCHTGTTRVPLGKRQLIINQKIIPFINLDTIVSETIMSLSASDKTFLQHHKSLQNKSPITPNSIPR
ncbi:hypothetical protein CONCODRAFT_12065 [Conidiobolus coronatus NRRL 28638]|uniref:Uncharacterized protein n=1 Tax=Conidiobolus coronatus (strain ATCC 28846 / CBS 209.66 / NRRL 28638) TaxID=796925 RepID=A0A137NTP7_CONC2|nr:hypothetical protein CONCODRAFT_12065 [Conidiobolus coronatus NRRL 28638]|eukprot:KXN66147.1 hypothetical protein CONCODRAFT_12065 [Conidiobolus coronatus NRRL 28638]